MQRWFDVQTLSALARYRRVVNSSDIVTASHMQDQLVIRGRFKFDRAGRYSLNAGWQTGGSFTAGWNNAGWGTGGPRDVGLHLKQLFVAAAPVKGLELSYGSLAVARGESTEITTFDNDGYVAAARGTIRRPHDLFFDEVSVTAGHLGDLNSPGFSDRASGLADFNYTQVLVGKKSGASLAWSADETHLAGADTFRNAFALKTRRPRIVDLVRYEHYWRVNHQAAYGFAAYAEKALNTRVVVGAGYADIDEHYNGLNSDRFNRGRRFFETVNLKICRDLTASMFDGHAVGNAFAVPNRHRLDLIVGYNVLGPLQRAGVFR